ncbi:MAG TPA: class I SAM-dependent methyltransferase, partial [Polyangiales bacterium]|nr:class I SAM-dependent methyltransferase [Polyangiales bacterium]
MERFAEGHSERLASDFDHVASRYDTLQRFNPGYRADLLRSARRLAAPADGRLLDLCCGTGLSTSALRACYPHARITGVDISPGMLAAARAKPELHDVRFIAGNAMSLEAIGAQGPYDGVLMAYGIRNVPDPDRCLVQLREQLKPGGRVVFHEYSVAGRPVSRAIWNVVAASVIVPLGTAVTGSGDLFRYLRRSVNEFDSLTQFEQRLRAAEFTNIRVEPMPGYRRGILHSVI